jgi:hypothetical protein
VDKTFTGGRRGAQTRRVDVLSSPSSIYLHAFPRNFESLASLHAQHLPHGNGLEHVVFGRREHGGLHVHAVPRDGSRTEGPAHS